MMFPTLYKLQSCEVFCQTNDMCKLQLGSQECENNFFLVTLVLDLGMFKGFIIGRINNFTIIFCAVVPVKLATNQANKQAINIDIGSEHNNGTTYQGREIVVCLLRTSLGLRITLLQISYLEPNGFELRFSQQQYRKKDLDILPTYVKI